MEENGVYVLKTISWILYVSGEYKETKLQKNQNRI